MSRLNHGVCATGGINPSSNMAPPTKLIKDLVLWFYFILSVDTGIQ